MKIKFTISEVEKIINNGLKFYSSNAIIKSILNECKSVIEYDKRHYNFGDEKIYDVPVIYYKLLDDEF